MKRFFKILSIIAALTLSSCSNFLSEVPQSMLTPENSLTTFEDWNKTLTGAYATLQSVFVGKQTITLSELGTDEVEPFNISYQAYSQLKLYTFAADHEFFRTHYVHCYEGIKRCNIVISMPQSAPVSDSERETMIAQAKFLRAIYYFDLVRMYGGVPMWLSSSVDKDQIMKPRSSAEDVYAQITKDMSEAASALPKTWDNAKDKGRATSHAANALLGKIYLQWGKADKALIYLNKVIGQFSLYDNYADIFSPEHKNEEVENIFEVQFKHSGSWGLEGSLQSSYWGPRGVGGPTNGGGWGGFGATKYLYDSYDSRDIRKTEFFYTEFKGVVQNPPCIKKYVDPEFGNVIEDDNLNFIMIRYADVLLLTSEALHRSGDTSSLKYDYLHQVRERAGFGDSDKITTDENFLDILLKERMLELCCEHHRRFDLIRFGKLAEQMQLVYSVAIKDYHTLYPIPQTAIDANEAISENNPGY